MHRPLHHRRADVIHRLGHAAALERFRDALGLLLVAVVRRTDFQLRAGPHLPLLQRVHDFVGQELFAIGAGRARAVGAEVDVLADGEGAGAEGVGERAARIIVVHAHAIERSSKVRFERRAQLAWQRRAGRHRPLHGQVPRAALQAEERVARAGRADGRGLRLRFSRGGSEGQRTHGSQCASAFPPRQRAGRGPCARVQWGTASSDRRVKRFSRFLHY